MWKKWLVALLMTVAIIVCMPMLVSASDDKVLLPTVAQKRYNEPAYSEEMLNRYVDVDEFRQYLFSQMKECKDTIDIARFNLPSTTTMVNTICQFIWYQMPEAFNFDTSRFMYNTYQQKLTSMEQICYYGFADTATEFDACWEEFERAANKMLYGIEGNTALSDEQKALLLHDRLAVWTEYDYEGYTSNTLPRESYTAYGAFGKRVAVCQGYALAYDYMLERIGIRSDLCPSVQLNHIWNIVYIDGYAYHVDVTWDDPVWDVGGQVLHVNFLRSSNGMYQTGHKATDYDTTPYSTKYDSYYWQSSDAEIQLVDNSLYYLDKNTQTLNVLENDTHRVVMSIANQWRMDASSAWSGNFSRLSSIGGELLISTPTSIYAYNTVNGSKMTVCSPSMPASYYYIYGFTYEDGKLVYELANTPNFDRYTKRNGRREQSYYGTYVTPASLSILSSPAAKTYYIGDNVYTSGLEMLVTYTDGSTERVFSGFVFRDTNTSVAGTKAIPVTYGTATVSFNITIKTPKVVLNKYSITADCNDTTATLKVTTQPSGQHVTYSFSDKNVVRRGSGDNLILDEDGTATVMVSFTYNGITYTATCKVTVDREHHPTTKTIPASFGKNGQVVRSCENCGLQYSSTTIYAPTSIALSTSIYTYNGAVRTPNVVVKDATGKALTKNTHYTATYPSGRKNAGTYKIKITFKGRYTGTKYVSFVIKPIDISKCTAKLSATSYTYNGAVKTPRLTVKNANGTILTQNTHYTASYASGRKNAGTYKVTVKMKGNYGGTKTLSFKINPISISRCSVKLSKTSFTYNGSTHSLPVVVKNANGTVLKKDTHYTVLRVTGGKNAGTHQVLVKMKGNYGGSKTLKYTIKPVSISKCTVKLENTSLIYTGKILPVTAIVKNAGGTKLKKDTHFTVKHVTGGKMVGEHKVKITMKGNYSGSKTLTYRIFPQTTKITQLQYQGSKLTVFVAARTAQVSGYQVQHSTSSSFKNAKTVTVAGNKNTRLPVTVPTAKRKYYVRVRTYKDVGGVRYCSHWETYFYERY